MENCPVGAKEAKFDSQHNFGDENLRRLLRPKTILPEWSLQFADQCNEYNFHSVSGPAVSGDLRIWAKH